MPKVVSCFRRAAARGLLLFTFLAVPIYSQTQQAGMNGSVRDAQENAMPEVLVSVRQNETLLVRTTRTSNAGTYFLGALPIGRYTVTFSKPGFRQLELKDIRLFVGQARTVDASMALQGRSEQVTVVTQASEIDRNSASIRGRIEQAQLDGLPINGRNWASLLPLVPGATDNGTSDQRSVRFAGYGRDDNNVTFDGVDATGIANQPQRTGVRLAIPTSAIAEFKVDSTVYSADSADGIGGQIVLASTAGTNSFHGEAFEFLRNSFFDARNPFATTQTTPPFHLNQFGANLGGPIYRNKAFFFLAYEGLQQSLDQALQGFASSPAFRARALQIPAIVPLINSFPATNLQPTSNADISLFSGLSPQSAAENSGMVRLDYHFTDRLLAFLRVNVDEAVASTPLNNLTDRTTTDIRPINGVLNVTSVLSPRSINELKFGFNQVFYRSINNTGSPYTIAISGFTNVSAANTREEDGTTGSLIDNFSFTKGRHTIRTGAAGRRVYLNLGNSASGTLTYANTGTFLLNQLSSASVTGAVPLKRLRKNEAFGFIQDEFKATANLTLNIGLRYQFFNTFHERDGLANPFDFASCGGFCPAGTAFSHPRTNDLEPRIGVAWSPSRMNGKTVIRSGFGIYHAEGQLEDQSLAATNNQPSYSFSLQQQRGLSYPLTPFLAVATGTLSPRAQDRNRKDESSAQWDLTMQQEFAGHLIGSVAYAGNKGTNLATITYQNLINPITGLRPYPQFGQIEYRTAQNNSTFHSMIASLQRSFHSGWVLNANYMWSHAINDGSLGGGEADIIAPQNPFCRACDRASSAQDIRHFFTANSVYELPIGKGKALLTQPGLLQTLLGNWTLSGIGIARSGLPVNITLTRSTTVVPYAYTTSQRPNLVSGVSLTPPNGSTVAQWINPAAFSVPAPGTFGNAGRDLARGPNFYQLDVALGKRFSITERAALEFRWEVFNAFNRAQYGQPSGNVTVPAQLGAITSTINTTQLGTGTPRQMQFMLKATF